MSEKAKQRVQVQVPSRLAGQGITGADYAAAKKAGEKWCKVCGAFLPRALFRNTQAYCEEHYTIHHRGETLKKYGLTPEAFASLLAEQNHRCAICAVQDSGERNWNVDHEHTTGAVRGLLCRGCNVPLHKLERDLTWAAKAIAYLTQGSRLAA